MFNYNRCGNGKLFRKVKLKFFNKNFLNYRDATPQLGCIQQVYLNKVFE